MTYEIILECFIKKKDNLKKSNIIALFASDSKLYVVLEETIFQITSTTFSRGYYTLRQVLLLDLCPLQFHDLF